jgi:hypothetical protein
MKNKDEFHKTRTYDVSSSVASRNALELAISVQSIVSNDDDDEFLSFEAFEALSNESMKSPSKLKHTTVEEIETSLITPEKQHPAVDSTFTLSGQQLPTATSPKVQLETTTSSYNVSNLTPVRTLALSTTDNTAHRSFLDPFPTPTGGTNITGTDTATYALTDADDTNTDAGEGRQDNLHGRYLEEFWGGRNTNYTLRRRKKISQAFLPLDEIITNDSSTSNYSCIATDQEELPLGSNITTNSNDPHPNKEDSANANTPITTPLRRQILLQKIQNTSKRIRRKLTPRRHSRRSSSSSSSIFLQQQSAKQVSTSWLIPADHPLKLAWDVTTVCISLFSAYFTHTSIQERDYDRSGFLIRFCEIWFLVDIFLNFVTQYRYTPPPTIGSVGVSTTNMDTSGNQKSDATATNNNNPSQQPQQSCIVLASPQKVWARYLTTWFLIDVISFIPWEKIWVKPIVEMQKRRNIVQKVGRRSKVVLKIGRMLRGRHIRWFQHATRWTKRVVGYDGRRLLVLIIKYIPKYFTFVKNMRAVLAIRLLRQIHWLRKVMSHLYNRDTKEKEKKSATEKDDKEDEAETIQDGEEDNDEISCYDDFTSDEDSKSTGDSSFDITEQLNMEIDEDYEPPFC